MGALDSWAVSTRRTIWARAVSEPTLVARTCPQSCPQGVYLDFIYHSMLIEGQGQKGASSDMQWPTVRVPPQSITRSCLGRAGTSITAASLLAGAHQELAALVDGASDDGIARPLEHRGSFAREHGLIGMAGALHHLPIHRDAGPWQHL